jgi:hypothetical protein
MPPLLRAPDGRLYVIAAPMRVGRDPANPIYLDDARASRVHATVWSEGDVVCVRDEGSSNGTFVNEVRIPPGQVFGLKPGDGFRIGGTVFLVEAAGAVSPGALPSAYAPLPAPVGGPPPGVTARMPVPPAAQPRRSSLPTLALGGCAVLILLLICGGAALLAVQRPPIVQTALAQVGGPAGTPGPATVPPQDIRLTIVETSPPPTPLSPEAFAAKQQSLAESVAELNRLQLELINLALAQAALESPNGVPRLGRVLFQGGAITNASFTPIETKALDLMADAGDLAFNTVSQGNGDGILSQTMASIYSTLKQQAAGTVVKVDALRNKWNAGQITAADLAAQLAQASGLVWNPAVTQPGATGNPFVGLSADPAAVPVAAPVAVESYSALPIQANDPANALGWVAVSPANGQETITLPAGGPLQNPGNPATLVELAQSNGPVDPAALAQAAAAALAAYANDPAANTVTIPKVAVVVADPQTSANGQPPPGFPGGQVIVITKNSSNPDANDLAGDLLGLDGNNQPSNQGRTPIERVPPAVSLTISNLTILNVTKFPKGSGTFEGEVQYSFQVQWQTNFASPQFELDCVSGNHFNITSAGGSQQISAKGLLLLYPGAEDAYCYASHEGNTWGSVSTRFLVGDAAEATRRADQVETDAVALSITLTADAVGTEMVAQTARAATQAVLGTQHALETEVGASQTAEFAITITYIAQNDGNAATQTQAAKQDTDGDGISDLNDRCVSQAETANGWRDDDGCADSLPTMNITAAAFAETLTNGPVNAFSTVADMTVDFNTGDSFGTLTGSASWSGTYLCYDTGNGDTIETVTASYQAFYTADLIGGADGAARTFQADLLATGVTEIDLTQPFTDETCTFLNDADLDDDWSGEGTVSGTWDGNTFGTLATSWKADGNISVAGTWSGTITLTEN